MSFRWSYELRSDHPSVLLSFCPLALLSYRKFSWYWLICFFWNSVWCSRLMCCVLLCVTEPDLTKKNFSCLKNGANGPKIGFLGFIGNLLITFSWIWSIKKVHTISCVLALILYSEKILFLRYEPKCSWPIRLQDF